MGLNEVRNHTRLSFHIEKKMLLTLVDKMKPPGCEISQILGKMQGKHDKKGVFNVNQQVIKVCLVTVHAILLP